jgi:hypothetical protein
MSAGMGLAAAGLVAAAVALAPAGVASANNSNSNSNTNDVTQFGPDDFSAGAGSSSESTNWPPTDLGWPPKEILGGGENESGGNETSGRTNGRDEPASAPIVMPSGQSPQEPTHTPSTSAAAKPIIDASSP